VAPKGRVGSNPTPGANTILLENQPVARIFSTSFGILAAKFFQKIPASAEFVDEMIVSSGVTVPPVSFAVPVQLPRDYAVCPTKTAFHNNPNVSRLNDNGQVTGNNMLRRKGGYHAKVY
jgi:hypothetical protein